MKNTIDRSIDRLLQESGGLSDLKISRFRLGGISCALLWCEGMISLDHANSMVIKQLSGLGRRFFSGQKLLDHLAARCQNFAGTPIGEGELFHAVTSGNLVLLAEGADGALCYPQQGYPYRAVSESYTEENVRASREGFAEPIKVNMTLIRRRLKSRSLVVEPAVVGEDSRTDVALVYLADRVTGQLLAEVRKRLGSIRIGSVLESGFIEPFFEQDGYSMFSAVGHTERPDTFCAKISEGRIGLLVDGTPFALILPSLFIESFQSFDDYTGRAYFASFIRIVKLVCFFVSVLLPGSYVAVAGFHPETLPEKLLQSLVTAQQQVALPLFAEALFIHLVYEIVREAGLRLPRPVGHAVSLIGALVVGETAITAGLVGAPLVMIAAFTTVCSYLLPTLYQQMTVFRFGFIVLGALAGAVGITAGFCFLLLNICSVDAYGAPYTSPVTPYGGAALRDGILRRSWRVLARRRFRMSQLPGSEDSDGKR